MRATTRKLKVASIEVEWPASAQVELTMASRLHVPKMLRSRAARTHKAGGRSNTSSRGTGACICFRGDVIMRVGVNK